MRVARLGGEGAASSVLVDHEGCPVLFDCPGYPVLASSTPGDTQQQQQAGGRVQLQLAVPDVAAALSPELQLQAILITSAWGLLGLAHLQQQLQQRGADLPIHTCCTEPCLHFFHQLAQELLHASTALLLQPPPPPPQQQQQQQDLQVLAPLFTPEQLQGVLDATQVVRFGQRVQLPGCFGVTAEARPCGRGIGSCMWLMKCGDQRYTYLAPATLQPNWSAPMHSPSLRNLDVLLLGPGCVAAPHQHRHPAGSHAQQSALCADSSSVVTAMQAAAGAVARGGCVLVPVIAGDGAVLQLLEALPTALAAVAAAVAAAAGGPSQAPATTHVVYLSHAAADFLATANSCCEYLEPRRQQLVLASGTAPFGTEDLLQSGQLLLRAPEAEEGASSSSSSDWGPVVQRVLSMGPGCVVLVPLWSMAAGPGRMLAQAWSSSPLNLLLLPEAVPLTATWLQQCCDAGSLPPQHQWQWQVQYAPLAGNNTSLLSAAAADAGSSGSGSSNGARDHVLLPPLQGGLLAEELLAVMAGTVDLSAGPGQGATAASGTSATGAGTGDRLCRVVASSRDVGLLEAALQKQPRLSDGLRLELLLLPQAAAHSGSPALSWQHLQLPVPLVQAALASELADRLQLQRFKVAQQPLAAAGAEAAAAAGDAAAAGAGAAQQSYEVSVARVQALLTHRSGCWRLEPLPSGPRPEAVSAVLAQQQQPQQALLWGAISTSQLLADLQAAGYQAELMPSADAAPVTAIDIDNGAARILLSAHETEVVCDSSSMRRVLLKCLTSQLHSVR